MNASELIRKLKELKEIHGDLPVRHQDGCLYEVSDEPVESVEYVHVPLVHERYYRIS